MSEIDLNKVRIPLNWEEIFGRTAPVFLEIGSGKGLFSIEFASNHPEINYLSVERAPKYHRILAGRAAKRRLTNIRLIQSTAEDCIFRLIPRESLAAVFILFPDPWPKKRHHKRRLISAEIITGLRKILIDDAPLLIKSDHADYAAVIKEVLASAEGFSKLDPVKAFAELPQTGFETKYRTEGRKIYSFALKKSLRS